MQNCHAVTPPDTIVCMIKPIASITHFFKNYSTRTDRVFLLLTLITLLLGTLFAVLNVVFFRYPTILLFATSVDMWGWMQSLLLIVLCTNFFFYGMYIRERTPRSATFLWGLGLLAWAGIANLVIVNSIQSTPFTPIDVSLIHLDRLLGIHTSKLMLWTHDHPSIYRILDWVYNALLFELLGIPIVLTLFSARKELSIFYLAFMMTSLIGCLIYYFWPTMAPSGLVHSPYFSSAQEHTSLRFHQIHTFIRPHVADGGLIAFPSFHVIWAVLLTNACRAKKIFFYPAVAYNTLLILSTVMLGWHYLPDVIGGMVIAVAGILFAEYINNKK